MTTCNRCGHDASGAFCANCGADLRGPEDATSTSGTSQSAPHREGWHDESTYTGGYASYRSNNSANPAARSYGSSGALGHSGSAPAPIPPGKSGSRSNQMLATLVGVAAVAVFALVAYLVFKPSSGNSAPNATASNSTVASSSAASSSASTVTVPGQAQQTVTRTSTSQAQSADSGSNSGGSNTSGGYTYQQSGDSVTITDSSGNQVGNLHLNGYRSDWGEGQKLEWVNVSGCSAPILLWNAGKANSSGTFGLGGSGQYELYRSDGTDLVPDNGSGMAATSFGVWDRQAGIITYADSKSDWHSSEHQFDRCESDGKSLHFSGTVTR